MPGNVGDYNNYFGKAYLLVNPATRLHVFLLFELGANDVVSSCAQFGSAAASRLRNVF